MAEHTLGDPADPPMSFHNICDDCLRDLAHQVPLEMVLEREDVKEYIHIEIAKALTAVKVDWAAGMDKVDGIDRSTPNWANEQINVTAEEDLKPLQEASDSLPFADEPDWMGGKAGEPAPDERTEADILKEYSWNDLRNLAKELGVESFGIKRPELEAAVLEALKKQGEAE
jgi:hypothetical protein